MANSKYEYVRSFELPDNLLANTWIVVRIDGRGFTKLTTKYGFIKPNDRAALDLMNSAAEAVMKELPDLVVAYGNSDEYSFVFHKDCVLFERRASKLTTTIVSTFTSYYTFLWGDYFPDKPLTPPLPSFDGRAVCYPSDFNLRDYMSWRQVDCHINNLYNTTFWALVQQGGMEARAAEQRLSGTVSSDKNEILFKEFGINYNNEPEIFKKGTVLYRDFFPIPKQTSPEPAQIEQASLPLFQPQAKSPPARPMSQPLERTAPGLLRELATSTETTPRGPTFLSTSRTPSPQPVPPPASKSPLNPLQSHPVTNNTVYPQTFVPVHSHHQANSSISSTHTKAPLPVLTPLPLPPPTLRPSTKPPPCLSPPNAISQLNTSPIPSPVDPSSLPYRALTGNPVGNYAANSTSTSTGRPITSKVDSSRPNIPRRTPSLSILDFGRPQIPVRISSIPANSKPRKLSLPSHKSFGSLKPEEKENLPIGFEQARRTTPPQLRTMKELPSPPSPPYDDIATRNAVMGSDLLEWSTSPVRGIEASPERVESDHDLAEPSYLSMNPSPPSGGGFTLSPAPPPPAKSSSRFSRHPRMHSAPSSSYIPEFTSPFGEREKLKCKEREAVWTSPTHPSTMTPPPSSKPKDYQQVNDREREKEREKKKSNKVKSKITEEGGWAAGTQTNEGRPVQMSRTQRDKERKKRSKARVVVEHVDIIKDEFWEKRPWILSGKTGSG